MCFALLNQKTHFKAKTIVLAIPAGVVGYSASEVLRGAMPFLPFRW